MIIVFINAYDRNILQLIWNLNTRINCKEYFWHILFCIKSADFVKIKVKSY